jgi:hypothetical protein
MMQQVDQQIRAPIFRSFKQIVPAGAWANPVPAKPSRRSNSTST